MIELFNQRVRVIILKIAYLKYADKQSISRGTLKYAARNPK